MANEETTKQLDSLVALPEETIAALRLIAEVTGMPAGDHLNLAVREYTTAQLSAPDFNDRLEARRQKAQSDIDRLLSAANPGS